MSLLLFCRRVFWQISCHLDSRTFLYPTASLARLKILCLIFVRFSEIPTRLPFRFFFAEKNLLASSIRSKFYNNRPNFLVFHLPIFFRLGKYFSLSFHTNSVRAINAALGNSTRHSGPSQNRGPVRYLPTRKAVLINDCSLYIILKVAVCFLDQYSMIKYAFCSLYPILIIK